jgi:ABC-2 type transport system permease protein
MNAIYTLWLRQIKRYFRSKSRIIGSLGQPVLFLVALGFGFGPVFERAGGGNYLQFLVPGIIAMAVLFTAVFSGIEIIWDKQFGFLKETLVAPVSRGYIMIGRTLGGATVALFQGLLVFFIALLIGFQPVSWFGAPMAVVYLALEALLFTALGTGIASLLDDMQGFQLIMNFLIMPIFFLSGALFPLATAPAGLKAIATINPLSYAIDGMRSVLSAGSYFGHLSNLLVLLTVTIILITAGSYLFSRIEI